MQQRLEALGDVLYQLSRNPETLPWDGSLYIRGTYPYTKDDLCCAVTEELDEQKQLAFRREHQLTRRLNFDSVHRIVQTVMKRIESPGVKTLIEQFNYYVQHDAFLLHERLHEGKTVLTRLDDVLLSIKGKSAHNYEGWLYIQGPYPWAGDELCCFIQQEKDDNLIDPAFAVSYRLNKSLDSGSVVSIVWVANEQYENATAKQLVESFNYYWRNDAFLHQEYDNMRWPTLSDRARALFAGLTSRAGALMVRLHIHPDWITAFGTLLVLAAAVFIARGQFQAGGVLLLLSLPLDALDGATARAMGRTDRRGAVLDSTLDRYADGFIMGGLILYFASVNDTGMLLLSLAGLVGMFAVSYIRARAGEADLSVKIGLFSRFERVITLLLMFLVPPLLPTGVWVLAIGTNLTALQRLVYVYRHLDR